MKKQLRMATAMVAGTMLLAACGSSDMKGYKQTDNGLYYRFEQQCNDSLQVQEGDVLVGEMTIRLDTTVLRTNVGHTERLMPALPMYDGVLHEGIMMMHKGDRAIFAVEADSMAKFMQPNQMPPMYVEGKGMKFYYEINLQDIVTKDEFAEEQANYQLEMEKARTAEPELIAAYVQEHGIKAQPNAKGLYVIVNKKGNGPAVAVGREVTISYTGRLLDGTMFDSSNEADCKASGLECHEPLNYVVGQMSLIPGWDEGVMGQPEGSKLQLIIPSALGYGSQGAGQFIPPYSPLVFDIEIVSVK
ncbi:MAG: FKBP-type peptidyl-prolyl cis-trans isomerase [Bacteroidales bacterium]|nr:FKBP-type peptidyl-prolyl cis-trans isomerase [Bacteroidales bacterium]